MSLFKKTFVILLLTVVGATSLNAQTNSYRCLYQEKIDISDKISERMGDGPEKDAVLAYMNKRKSYYTLTFANGKSFFEKNNELSDDDFGMGGMSPSYYVDFDKQEQTTVMNFFGRQFLIIDSTKNMNWVFTNETRQIGDFECVKATTGDTVEIVAWFSMATPIPAGPNVYYGLPGLVVEAVIGPVTYTLTEIKVLDKDPKLKQPSKGKKVTMKEFEEIVRQKLDEMGFGGMGDGANVIRF